MTRALEFEGEIFPLVLPQLGKGHAAPSITCTQLVQVTVYIVVLHFFHTNMFEIFFPCDFQQALCGYAEVLCVQRVLLQPWDTMLLSRA